MELKESITLLIALYGAALSTVVAIHAFLKERRQVRVRVEPSFYAYPDGSLSTQMASLEIVNGGRRPVTVGAPTLRMPNRKFLSFGGARGFDQFPRTLEDGEKASLDLRYREISDALKAAGYRGKVTVRPTCKDTIGKRYWGKRWSIDTNADWNP